MAFRGIVKLAIQKYCKGNESMKNKVFRIYVDGKLRLVTGHKFSMAC